MRSDLWSSLLRLLTLRPAERLPALASDRVLALLGALAFGLWAAIDRWEAGPDARFDIYGLAGLALPILAVLLLALVLSRRSRPQVPFRQTLLVLLTVISPLLAAGALIDQYASPQAATSLQILALLYAAVCVARALSHWSGSAQPGALLLALVLLLGYGWLADGADVAPTLWPVPAAGDAADETASPEVAEPLLFDQRARIDDALDGIAPSDAADPEVFFVGFAGVAEQRVFSEEIKLAARVIGRRYGSAARQLLLINDRRDLDTYPLASLSALTYALDGLAEKMDLDRDVLFLALSSHGSSDPELSVSNGTLPLEPITGEGLAAALRDSGIKWRVIVISACYAGAFIDALKDDHTIVITAAEADRTSFGCADDRDLTYFGEAFYRDSLPLADSLRQAFGLAALEISRREQQQHLTPSRPQAFFGSDIERVLRRLDATRADAGVPMFTTRNTIAR